MVYTKGKETLVVANRFIYQEDLYLLYPNRCQWFRTKNYVSNSLIDKKSSTVYNKKYKCNIQRYWELIAAPKEYLISQGFKPKV